MHTLDLAVFHLSSVVIFQISFLLFVFFSQTHVTYEWLEPQYCNEDHPNSVNLPEVGEEIECPSCNPGQSMSEAGVCTDCDDGEFSDGSVECQQCPLHTVAHKSLSFRHFHVVPDRFSTGCIKTNGGKQIGNITWNFTRQQFRPLISSISL